MAEDHSQRNWRATADDAQQSSGGINSGGIGSHSDDSDRLEQPVQEKEAEIPISQYFDPNSSHGQKEMGANPEGGPSRTDSALTRHDTVTTSRTITLDRQPSLTNTVSRVPTATKPPTFSTAHEILFIAVISSAQLLTQSALAQSIAPLHVIGRTFNTTNPGQLSWLAAGYSLTVGTFILPAGRWGDLYGHKRLFIGGYFWFAVWSMVAGFAAFSRSLIFFAFCRGMQGIGPAILLPNGIAVLARTYPPGKKKNMVLSIFGATAPVGFVVGAVFSGIFAQFVWWPWAYWVLAMVLALLGVLVIFVVPAMPVAGPSATFHELDATGTVLGVLGLIFFNFAWNEGPAAGWGKVYVYVLLIVGVVLLVAFFWFEKKRATFPLLPMSSFTMDTNLVFGCEALGWSSFGVWVFYLWQFLELERGQSILLSAAQLVPTALSGCMAAITTGLLIAKMQPGWIMLISISAFLTGMILLATMPVHQTYWAQTFVATVITPWGMDMSFPSGNIVLSDHMPPEHQGLAASLINTVINYSISIGLGMAGTVEVNVNSGGRNQLQGYRGAWYLAIGFDGLGILCAICLILSWRARVKGKQKVNNQKEVDLA
ncbi:uncharacterized protein PV07_01930 [Cladophialophora immunda]|uniref:Major facilitator superfamily (MFS) profile domain-containing protein n=1 Tax=Cladophialophora immunda TaxID=569365 RepID=A0A0D2CVU5_9EURO|nr:uncharacterized protein PV07_01930 [Cladophialophora immunda]KIW35223.1 hypothetical protein PV07_01930 [Cladophialophora immunda]OQV03882.1 hypothetical protein CLAIMM_08864 isoform 2 [Cladophialophora immunda]